MYLEHFHFTKKPFSLTPDTQLFCNMASYQQVLSSIVYCLKQGDGFIKVVGEVGVGKTMLCRMLLNTLQNNFVTAYIPNSNLSPDSLRKMIAMELGIAIDDNEQEHTVLNKINTALLDFKKADKKVILIVDEAQVLPIESFETIRLLTNLETENEKLLQVVLFAQPEIEEILKQKNMRQLLQRISYSFELTALSKEELDQYLAHRLVSAGHKNGYLFSKKARQYIFQKSGGIPRVVNILCDKALLVAYSKGKHGVTLKDLKKAVRDSQHLISTVTREKSYSIGTIIFGAILFFEVAFTSYLYIRH